MEHQTLAYSNPADFRTQSVTARKRAGTIDLSYSGKDIDFNEMMKHRTPVDPSEVLKEMQGQGHTFANIGVGTILTLTFQGKDYLAGTIQEREELGDFVFNPIGGYVHSRDLNRLDFAGLTEVAEEFLPITGKNEIMRFSRRGAVIGRPYSGKYPGFETLINLKTPARYQAPNLENCVTVRGASLRDSPQILFETPRNAAKLVFNYHMETAFTNFGDLGVSFHGAEEKFNSKAEDPSKALETFLNPYGIALIQLQRGQLTENVFQMISGELSPGNPQEIALSEVFLADENAIAERNTMPLPEFLRSQ